MLIQENQSVISSNLYKSLPFGVVFIGKDNMYLPLNEINEGLLVDKKVNE